MFGDAICSVNPIYGRGMSVAALLAAALQEALAEGDRDLARRFFQAAAKPVGTAWQRTVGADLSLPRVQGPRPLPVQLVNAYVTWVQRAAERDPVVAEQFLRTASLQDPPTTVAAADGRQEPVLAWQEQCRTPLSGTRATPDFCEPIIVLISAAGWPGRLPVLAT